MRRNKEHIKTLAKITTLDSNNEYVHLIEEVCKNKNVKNIGIFGIYGSGKSSVVGSFLSKSKKAKKTIYFSQETFKKYEKLHDDTSLFRSVFYKELLNYDKNILNISEFKRSAHTTIIRRIMFISSIIGNLLLSLFAGHFLYRYFGLTSILLSGTIFILLSLLALFLLGNKIDSLSINLANYLTMNIKTTDSNPFSDDNSVIENLIIQILSSRGIKYVVFEDIDRFFEGDIDKIRKLILEIKLMNELINRSKLYQKNRIVFFYGIKDGCFANSEERTKYFDFILPVFPFASHSNAKAAILNDPIIKSYFNQNDEIISAISPFFSNQREVNAFLIEFDLLRKKNSVSFHILQKEIAALSALNVLFPLAFNDLYNRTNYLRHILSEFELDESLYSEILSYLETYKTEVVANNGLIYRDKKQLELLTRFLTSSILNGSINLNYEQIIVENRGKFLSDHDNEIEQKIRAFIDISDEQINNPVNLIKNFHPRALLVEKQRFLNADLANGVMEFGEEKLVEGLSSLLNECSKERLQLFLLQYFKKYNSIEKIRFIATLFKNNKTPYLNINKYDCKENFAFCLFEKGEIDFLIKNKDIFKDYFDLIKTDIFLNKYANKLDIRILKSYFENNLIVFPLVTYWGKSGDYIALFKEFCSFDCNLENITSVFDDFCIDTSTVINKNPALLNFLQLHKNEIVKLFDQVEGENENHEKIMSLCLSLFKVDPDERIFETKFFKRWKFSLQIPSFSGTKTELLLLRNGMICLDDQKFTSNILSKYPDSFSLGIQNNIDYIKKEIIFNETISWLLVSKMTTDKIQILYPHLTLTNVETFYNKYKKDIYRAIEFLTNSDKTKLIELIIKNDNDGFVKLLETGSIIKDNLLTISLDESLLEKGIAESRFYITNLFAFGKSTKTASSYISKNNDKATWMIFYNEKGFVGTDDENLVLEFCLNHNTKNFDKVTSLICSLDNELFACKSKWLDFLASISVSKNSKYIYLPNYDNNKKITEKLLEVKMIKGFTDLNKVDQIRVRI